MCRLSILGQNQGPGNVIWIIAAVVALIFLAWTLFVFKYFRLWIRCHLSNAQVSLPEILGMSLRKIPPRLICDLRIMSVQAGVPVSVQDLQAGYLAGADIELVIRAMIRARQRGEEITWEETLARALEKQYDDALDRRRNDP